MFIRLWGDLFWQCFSSILISVFIVGVSIASHPRMCQHWRCPMLVNYCFKNFSLWTLFPDSHSSAIMKLASDEANVRSETRNMFPFWCCCCCCYSSKEAGYILMCTSVAIHTSCWNLHYCTMIMYRIQTKNTIKVERDYLLIVK